MMIKFKKIKKGKLPKIDIKSAKAHYVTTSVGIISFFVAIFVSIIVFYSSLYQQIEYIDNQKTMISHSYAVRYQLIV